MFNQLTALCDNYGLNIDEVINDSGDLICPISEEFKYDPIKVTTGDNQTFTLTNLSLSNGATAVPVKTSPLLIHIPEKLSDGILVKKMMAYGNKSLVIYKTKLASYN
ncbi:MAG: hypothetical protein HWD59_10375 [Coxiellaceae bacterium]|nr:MAG: hypothetical protein HWD59_10375 [Coxiellaceae bacterium]